MCVLYMLSGCSSLLELALDAVDERAKEAAKETTRNSRYKNEVAKQKSANPLDSPAEDRLTRRTSTLDGGIPVDVSSYLLHNYSFAVTEKGMQHTESIFKSSNENGFLEEFDTVLTFNANKQSYEMNVTVATDSGGIDSKIKRRLGEFAAGLFGLEQNKIQNFNVQILKKRGHVYLWYINIDNVLPIVNVVKTVKIMQ